MEDHEQICRPAVLLKICKINEGPAVYLHMGARDDWELVDEYASTGSRAAFEELVARHSGWVYATARRRTKSADLAEDVTQAAFIVLARKARSIGRKRSLSAWLYRVVQYAAVDALRRQGARRRHEQAAAKPERVMAAADSNDAILEHLDAALDTLGGKDREAVVLRFFNNQTLEQIGRSQQVNASTVQRRIERALAGLGYQLKRKGVVTAPATLAGTLAAVGLCSAPNSATAGLTALATAATVLPAQTAGSVGLAKGTLKAMTLIKLKVAAASVVAAIAVGTGGVVITRAVAQIADRPADRISARANTDSAGADQPPAIDPQQAKQFRSDWLASQLTLRRLNPAHPSNNGRTDTRSLSINGQITVLDTNHILGFDRWSNLNVNRIVDDAGHDVTSLAVQNSQNQAWFAPLSYNQRFDNQTRQWVEDLQPQAFNIPLRADATLPKRLAAVEGYLTVLTYDRQEHVDVPFEPNAQPVAILPGVRVHFAAANQEGDSYSYQLVSDTPASKQPFNGMVRDGESLPARMIINDHLVDRDGKQLDHSAHAFGNFPAIAAGQNGSGGVDPGARIAAMRIDIAVGVHERRVPVALENIDLPAQGGADH